jgi:transposase-like protein
MSSSEARRIHIEAWQNSGMSQAAYCREHDLNTKTFGNWVRKHRRAGQGVRSPALVPVTIKPMLMPANTLRLRGRGDHVLELPSTVSPHWLGELLKCL